MFPPKKAGGIGKMPGSMLGKPVADGARGSKAPKKGAPGKAPARGARMKPKALPPFMK